MRLCVVGLFPRHSWRRVPLVSLLLRVVDVMVLLWLLVLPGVVVDDAPGDVDAAGGDDGGFSLCCCYPWPRARWVALVAFVRQFCGRPWLGRRRCISVPGS